MQAIRATVWATILGAQWGGARTLCYFGRLGARNSFARCGKVLWQFLQGSACWAEATVPARCARAYFWRGNMRRTPETHRSRGFKEFGHTQAVSRFGSSLPTTACTYKNDGFRIGLPCLSNLALHTIPPPRYQTVVCVSNRVHLLPRGILSFWPHAARPLLHERWPPPGQEDRHNAEGQRRRARQIRVLHLPHPTQGESLRVSHTALLIPRPIQEMR